MQKKWMAVFFICMGLAFGSVQAQEPTDQEKSVLNRIKWQEGPCISDLGEAEVRVPSGFVFANASDTKILMEAMHNPVTGVEVGFLGPTTLEWFIVFEFEKVGYIKDDEKTSLDAEAMLESIRKGNEQGNKERLQKGWKPLSIVGWYRPPQYNEETHNLEWATKFDLEGESIVNWNTRLLGRRGVMSATLVAGTETLEDLIPKYQNLLEGFSYKSGYKYSEYRRGDKIAQYGLSALVVGGAAAVAAKTGLFKYIGKFLIVICVAVGAFFKKIWAKIRNKES